MSYPLNMLRSSLSALRGDRLAALPLVFALLVAASAQARVDTVRWSHPSPGDVAGFKIYVGVDPGSYQAPIDAGKPTAGSAGDFEFALEVIDGLSVYVAVSAYAFDGRESPLSDAFYREAPGSGGGDPPPSDPPPSDPPPSDPPESAVYSNDFESSSLGSSVPNWWDTRDGFTSDDSLFSVVSFGGGRVFSTSSTRTDIHSHYGGTGSTTWSSYELSGRMRGSSSSSRLGVTAYSGFPSADVYYRLGTHWQTAELELYRHPSPDSTLQCSSSGTGVTLQQDRWYRFRFQVESTSSGTNLRAKAWIDGQSEPSGWSAQCTDTRSGRPASGTVGVWSGSGGTKYWDDLAVAPIGEGGASPPPPPEPEPLGAPGQPYIP